MDSKAGASCCHPSEFPPSVLPMVDMYVPPNPCEAGRETPPHLPLPLPQTLHLSVLHHWPWVTVRLAGAYPVYGRRHTGPEIVESEWYSRRRIVFVSGPADRWAPFHLTRASLLDTTACATGPLRSVGVTRLQPYYGPGRRRLVLSLSRCFAGYRLYVVPCSTGFWVGRGRAPVAQHFLVTVLSLPPRRSDMPRHVNLCHTMLPSPDQRRLGLRS